MLPNRNAARPMEGVNLISYRNFERLTLTFSGSGKRDKDLFMLSSREFKYKSDVSIVRNT